MRQPIRIAISFVLIFFLTLHADEIKIRENWAVEVGANGGGSPVFFPDEVDPTHIVVGGQDGKIYLINGDGEVKFVYDMAEPTHCSPAVGDLDGDGVAEIVSATANGVVHAIDAHGKKLWQFRGDGPINYTLALGDVNGDGRLQVLAAAKTGWLYCLNGDGTLRWRFKAEANAGPPAVGDLNNDGSPEIIFGSDLEKIYCVDANGRYVWHIEINGHFGRSLPLIADIDGDGNMEALITRSEVGPNAAVIAIDGRGDILWQARTTLHGYGPLAVADIDDDGEQDILVVDKSTSIYCITPSGERKWQRVLLGHGIFYPPAVADLDGDGDVELVAGIRDGDNLVVLDRLGRIVGEIPVQGGGNSSPTIGDLDKDGRLEIYMLTQKPGRLVQWRVETAKSGAVKWGTWRADSRRTGFVPSARPGKERPFPFGQKASAADSGSMAALLGENIFNFSIDEKYRGQPLLLQSRLQRPDGAVIAALDFIEPNQENAAVAFDVDAPGEHVLELELLHRRTRKSLQSATVRVDPDQFTADIAFLDAKIAALDSLAQRLVNGDPADLDLLDAQKFALATQQRLLQRLAGDFKTMPQTQRRNRAAAVQKKREGFERRQRLLQFLGRLRAVGMQGPFVCWEDPNPWDDLPADAFYPQGDPAQWTVNVLALGRETESRALYVINLSDQTLYIKIMPVVWRDGQGNKLADSEILELREVVDVGTTAGRAVPDALPKLNEGKVLVVPPLQQRQLWLTLKTFGLPPGVYTADLELVALGMDDPRGVMPLRLEVSAVSLPEKSRLAFYTWAHLGGDPDSELNQKRFQDLLDHGTTVFSVSPPVQRFDENGDLVGEPDWSLHDAWMQKYRGKGIVLVMSFQNSIRGPESAPMWSEAWQTAYKAWLVRYAAHVRNLGFDDQDFALYPYDEPWLTGMERVQQLLRVARLTREADPRVQIYTDPAGMPTPENSVEAVPYIDIWMPQMDLFKEDKRLLNFYKNTGATVWAYEAPGPTKLLKPLGLYRMQPWLAFRYGLSGCGMWTYNYRNIWTTKQPAPFFFSYSIVYEDGETVVPSRRWEAYRDGVEDYNLLTLFKEEMEKPGTFRDQGLDFLDKTVMLVTAKQEQAKSINRQIVDYDPDYAQLRSLREKLIRALEAVQAGKAPEFGF